MKIKRYTLFVFILSFFPVLAIAQQAPQLIAPEDGASGLSTSITFQWSMVSNADTYQIQIAQSSGFENIIFERNTSSNFMTISGFPRGETFYWRVRAGETVLLITEYGDWSEVWSFSTVPPPPAVPELVSPEDGAQNVSTSPTLNWSNSEGAETYRVQVSDSGSFSSTAEDQSGLTSTEFQLSELQTGATYYWRVNASNEGGVSGWSETRNFTVIVDPPASPNLIAPENGAQNVSTTPLLEWESVENTDAYDFQIALDEGFNNKIVDQQNVTSTYYNGNFDEYTIHYWRVRAKNQGGESDWSDVWNFTTEPGESAISILTPRNKEVLKGTENHSITWHASNRVQEIIIEYTFDAEETWQVIEEGVDASTRSYTWSVPDTSSIHAQIKITDSENPDIFAVSDPFILYPSMMSLQHHWGFNSAGSSSDYRLIGLPANTNIPVEELFEGNPGNDWNVYFDNGNEENYLVPFDNSEIFIFQPGRAYWAISRSDIRISDTRESVELSPDTTFSIPLQEGWNIISNPFGREINWPEIQQLNELEDPIWAFDGTFRESSLFGIYEGYYFYNRNNLHELIIPYLSYTNGQDKQMKKETEEYQFITLNIIHNQEPISSIEAGINRNIHAESEPTYDFAPPGDFQEYKITIQSQEISQDYPLVRLFKLPSEQPQKYNLTIKSPEGETLHIRTDGLENFRSYEVLLVDKSTAKSYDLHKSPELRINSYSEVKEYSLMIGNSEVMSDLNEQILPRQTTLSQNYPNPFNNQTVFEYTIAENMANRRVTLEVYNVVGQKIATLVDETQPAGFYQVRWNTETNPGESLASGLYLYRLQIGDFVKTRQLTLIK